MFKSIFKKFLFTYMMISFLSLLLIAGVISHFMEQQVYAQREQILEQEALQVNKLFSHLVNNEITTDYFVNMLNMMQINDNLGISLILNDQTHINIEGFGRRPIRSNRSNINYTENEKEYFTAYFESEESEWDIQMLTVAIPLKIDNTLLGEVLIYSPVANMELITNNVNRLIFITFIAISLPTSLLLYFISKKFTSPLVHMNNIANNISKGDFSNTVEVKGNDEVAQLGHALNNMSAKIQGLEELRKDLIANVSHELKTPLTTIQNFIQGILDGVVPKDQKDNFMKIALNEVKRLGTMVEELIVLSSFEKKLINLNLVSINISTLINDVLIQMEFQIQKKNIQIEKNLDTSITKEIDQERFRQVLINLLDNGIRHSPKNSKIEISLEKSNKKKFILRIIDSGPGIKEEQIPYIFERFYKGDNNSEKPSGAGLGLTICKHIIKAHKGEISAENTENKGLGIEISL